MRDLTDLLLKRYQFLGGELVTIHHYDFYGDAAATQRAAREFKVFYEKRKTADGYSVDHSGQTYVLDPQGRLRLFVRPDRLASDLPEDLRTLLRQSSSS